MSIATSDTIAKRRLLTIRLAIMFLTFPLMLLGAYVRITGAGLACPDWPLCFGVVVPNFAHDGVLQEWLHRVLASSVGILAIVNLVLSYRQKDRVGFAALLLMLVIVQGVFGGLTVLLKLSPIIVASHLLLGSLFFAMTIVMVYGFSNATLSKAAIVISILLVAQILIGGLVSSGGAALSCPAIPHCEGNLLFGGSLPQYMQMLHRLNGLLLVGLSAIYAQSLLALLLLQLCIGFLNVYLEIPAIVTLLHLAVAELILFCLVRRYYCAARS